MGIRFSCPNGHLLNVKDHLAGKRGICPSCGAKFVIPAAADSAEASAVRLPAGAGVSTIAGATSQSEKPSVAIPVEDAPAAPQAGSPAAQIEVASNSVPAIPHAGTTPPSGPPPVMVTETELPESQAAAIKYVAHRERVRRNRTRVAILLLVAVIVLAGVLIWILVIGPAAVGSNENSPTILSSIHLSWGVTGFRIESPICGSDDEF
jgi:hypothetical protein